MFVGEKSNQWEIYPMTHEQKNGEALQYFVRTHGALIAIKTNCAQSELGTKWTETCQNKCIAQETTKPHNPQKILPKNVSVALVVW